MAVVEYTAMRRIGVLQALAILLIAAACATPVVLQHPATGQRVSCTMEAQRLAYDAPGPGVGTDVPWPRRGSPPLRAFDLEQRCAGELLSEGFVCVSGCTTPPP